MTDQSTDFCFTSDLFQIESGEDELTNPYRFGKQLSHWIAEKLSNDGYPDATVIPEDWGWCVMCSRDPFMLWVGCGNTETIEMLENPELVKTRPTTWQCFVVAEVPFWKRVFGRPETGPSQRRLNSKLQELFAAEPQIHMVDCP